MPRASSKRPKAKKVVLRRGVPEAKYRACYRLVQAGKTTWPELEAAGEVQRPRFDRDRSQSKRILQKLAMHRKKSGK